MTFGGWDKVAEALDAFAKAPPVLSEGGKDQDLLDYGQRASLAELARRIRDGKRAALVADEVGMGKTRIAVALIEAVRLAGGRSVVVLPAGLGVQWQAEFRRFNPQDRTLLPLRSYESFIAAFLDGEKTEGNHRGRNGYKRRMQDRRQGRELPDQGWRNEEVVLISQNFANINFPLPDTGAQHGWRRELLPSVRAIAEGKRRNKRSMNSIEHVRATHRVAEVIASAITENNFSGQLAGDHRKMPSADYRQQILPLIGYGLGHFDLVVIDEAHKARGAESSLSRILGAVIWESDDPFRLGMTATPVELGAHQWLDMLRRISGRAITMELAGADSLVNQLDGYVKVVERLQTEELDEALVNDFEHVARGFQTALSPFVLRRDKRSDPEISSFVEQHGDYRSLQDLSVAPDVEAAEFPRDWLRRFCAAEALSFLPQDDRRVKRLRLSIAQGHALDAVANGLLNNSDEEAGEAEEEPLADDTEGTLEGTAGARERAAVWLDAIGRGQGADIYTHPALLKTVGLIESYVAQDEKVLVFGRYIKPLNALTRLLDAREMLRCLSNGNHWPARKVSQDSEGAVQASLRDPRGKCGYDNLDAVNLALEESYKDWASERRSDLARLHREVGEIAKREDEWAATVLSDFWRRDNSEDGFNAHIGPLLEALDARRIGAKSTLWSAIDLVRSFGELLCELVGEDDNNKKPELDADRTVEDLSSGLFRS